MNHPFARARIEGDTVSMPREDFDLLVEAFEDAQDVEAYDRAMRKLASGEAETVPSAFVDRVLAGENLIRLWREHRGLTGKALAEQAGISPPFLSQIEQGQREPSIGVLKAIAKALGVGLEDIVG